MPPRGYEFYLRVQQDILQTSEIRSSMLEDKIHIIKKMYSSSSGEKVKTLIQYVVFQESMSH